jgi:hypothetical protein
VPLLRTLPPAMQHQSAACENCVKREKLLQYNPYAAKRCERPVTVSAHWSDKQNYDDVRCEIKGRESGAGAYGLVCEEGARST